MEDIGLIREEHLQRVIGLLRASYTHLVLDLSKSFAATDMTALRMADVILLVAQLELTQPAQRGPHACRRWAATTSWRTRFKVVLNRVGGETDITLKKAEETIGKPIYWQLPNDAKLMTESRTNGVPLVQHAPRSKLQQSFAGLAQALFGKEVPAPAKEKSARWALFSRR